MKILFATILLFLVSNAFAIAQPRDLTGQLLQIKSSSDSLTKNYPAEKLYLQLDKPNYAVGDTLWFKAYLFHAPTLALSAKSGIMYIDIANDNNKIVKQMRLQVSEGISWGNINLNDFPAAGNYILRAYTTWMRNFGDDCFYYKRFAIIGEQSPGMPVGTIENSPVSKRQQIKTGQPSLSDHGTALNVTDNADSITVSVTETSSQAQPGSSYFLIGKARNVICYAAVVDFNGKGIMNKSLSKSLFPSGVAHFILTDPKEQWLNEQLIFIDHHDNLHIALQTDKQVYNSRDSVSVHISVTDAKGNPVKGNFSMAITDDNQVAIDSLQDNIVSHVLLSSEFKGNLERFAYYLEHNIEQAHNALNNLLVSHDWISYSWPATVKQPLYPVETEFEVNGKVLNGFNAAVKSTKVTLFSKSPFILKDTITDKDGHFTFRNFPQIDTPVFFLSAVNRHGSSFNVGIVMNDPKPPLWNIYIGNSIADTLVDTGLVATAKNNRIRNEQAYLTPTGHLLKEVKIVAKKIVRGSQNLNGPGNADLVLDEADVVKEGKKSWIDIFLEKIKGFREQSFYTLPYYKIEDRMVIFLVDGIPITPMGVYDPQYYTDDIIHYLKTHSAEDIKGIEVNNSAQYNLKYNTFFFPGLLTDFAFIEITSRSGDGPHLRGTPGTYLYKPLAVSQPTQFYSPQYHVSDTSKHLPDTRSTIYWEPNINTNKNGEATICFYTADKPGIYTVILEGTDLNGNLGYKRQKITVVQPNHK